MIKDSVGNKKTVAVIDIGTSAIRMIIAEVDSKAEIRYLENLQKPVKFGKDVFATGRISQESMNQGIEILTNFKSVMDGYGVAKIQAIATSAMREASNRDNFIDRAYVRAGIDIEVIEGPEENRLELIAVEHALGDNLDLSKRNCLIVEVGSGSTEMIILNQGKVEITRTLSIGSIRLPEQAILAGKNDPELMQRVLKRSIREVAGYAAQEYNLNQIDTFIGMGGDMRFVAQQLPEIKRYENFSIHDKKSFQAFVSKFSKMTSDEVARQFTIPISQAETFYPALLYYSNFLNETQAESVVVPTLSIRDGLLVEMAQMFSGYRRTDVSRQILNSAGHLAEKYKYDKPHAQCVHAGAVKLFDALTGEHGMGSRERLLLEVSAVLHDIGTYISPAAHHKHSSYLVDSSDIFGLRKSDKNVVSSVVRYHRRTGPRAIHEPYMSLPKADRATVSKLAAILRVADALDHGHQQRIKAFELEKTDKSYTLWASAETGDISVERTSLEEKGDLFLDVFGLPVILRQRAAVKGS